MPQSPPCAIIIFGASGDLASRKLIPGVYEMAREGLLNDRSYILGYARSPMSDEEYRQECAESVRKFARTKPVDESLWKKLESRIYYAQPEGLDELRKYIERFWGDVLLRFQASARAKAKGKKK